MTNEAPTIGERYSTARQTSDLTLDPNTGMSPADVLTAAGWAAQENETAMMLWEVAYKGKTSAKLRLVELLGNDLNSRMAKDHRLKGDAWRIAAEILAWHLAGTCKPCGGLGYERPEGSPALTNRLCPACKGTKKVILKHESEAQKWMLNHLERLTTVAAGAVMRRLRVSMDL